MIHQSFTFLHVALCKKNPVPPLRHFALPGREMDSGTLTFFRPDSCIARRGSFSRGIVGDYRGSESTSTGSRTSLSPTQRNRISNGPKSPQVAPSFFSEHENTSFGDIFTAVLGSKLAKQPLPKSPQQKIEVPHLPRSKSTSAFTDKRPSTQTFLEPTKFLCRPREDRERQLDTRCLRIIGKLNCYLEYQEIVRRFACGGDEIEENGSPVSECVGKVRLRSLCGVRAYLMKYLKLKEPRQTLAVSQATLLSGDSTPDQSIAKESNGSPTRIDYRRTARNSITIDQFSEMMESFTTERPVQAVNGGSCGSASAQTPTKVTTLSPETLLRRLARSISTRLSYKRCLLENSTQRLEELKRETEVVRSVLRKVITDALPQVRSDADVFYFHIPQATSSTTPHKEMEVEMEVCQVASPINHNSHHHHQHNTLNNHNPFPDLSAATSVNSNLLPRLDRLISSQAAVLELICQLTRRLYCLDRKIAECLAKSPIPNDKKGEDAKEFNETDAVLVGSDDNLVYTSVVKIVSASKNSKWSFYRISGKLMLPLRHLQK